MGRESALGSARRSPPAEAAGAARPDSFGTGVPNRLGTRAWVPVAGVVGLQAGIGRGGHVGHEAGRLPRPETPELAFQSRLVDGVGARTGAAPGPR